MSWFPFYLSRCILSGTRYRYWICRDANYLVLVSNWTRTLLSPSTICARMSMPSCSSCVISLAAKKITHITGSPVAAVKSSTVKCASDVFSVTSAVCPLALSNRSPPIRPSSLIYVFFPTLSTSRTYLVWNSSIAKVTSYTAHFHRVDLEPTEILLRLCCSFDDGVDQQNSLAPAAIVAVPFELFGCKAHTARLEATHDHTPSRQLLLWYSWSHGACGYCPVIFVLYNPFCSFALFFIWLRLLWGSLLSAIFNPEKIAAASLKAFLFQSLRVYSSSIIESFSLHPCYYSSEIFFHFSLHSLC